ncbi:uncharacterized protein LOC111014937 isoform X2 [Momordica charantia]|uniref:Uncharacterized protein LOC111014937 isoform X2 n=1 Tax=Momordica charantia TaxID=3673 RepID=A0A6J1CW51_MOMCH|nr:uncharacterized protein LOC111014937 isoform X2 [Momordica charantia]
MEDEFNFYILILISLQFFLATSRTLNSSQELVSSSSQGVCSVINCGQGTCKASNASFLGFDCECNSGWRRLQIGSFTFPCVLPNWIPDFRRGGGSPLPPPLPPTTVVPFLPSPFGFSNPCRVVWCGNGTCVADGAGAAAFPYSCHCHEGFENLLNLTFLPCFKRCYFGEYCIGATSPQRNSSASVLQIIGSANKLKGSWNLPSIFIQVTAVTIQTWL